ncbi:MAG: DUF1524 domain-containing protein, partial [Bdellovibrionota bacterium]
IIRDEVVSWSYEEHSEKIRSTLLLFNIATLLRSNESNLRFQFDSYKKESWDIEHVRSVKSGKPGRADLQKSWIKTLLVHCTGFHDYNEQKDHITNLTESPEKERLGKAISLFDDKVFNSEMFDTLYEEFLLDFKEQDDRETDNSIGNLALLDATTNRSYKNAVFPIKRKRILDLDKSATFVPACTKNVFLKYYSSKIDQMMFWGEEDRDQYEKAIVETLVWFFSHEKVEVI